MDYERIEKKQKSMISPTKLRMKLMSPLNNKKKEGSKSNNNSSRTSPSRLQISDDTEFSKNSLLASKPDSDDDVAGTTTDVGETKLPNEPVLDLTENDNQASRHQCEGVVRENDNQRPQQFRKGDLSMAPPHIMRPQEDENLDYDSNVSSSSFEFHRARGERNNASRAYPTRQMPSKWNDAEKWIMNRQNMVMRKNSQGNRVPVRVVPDNAGYEHNKSRMDQCQSSQIDVFEKFPNLTQEYGGNSLIDQSTQSNDLVDTSKVSSHDNNTTGPPIRSVCMRDMGTEMTPIPSQEPSRSVTPVDATTPIRSPTSSLPSTPRGGQQEESSLSQDQSKNTRRELSEEEMKAKTRREIVALGVKLGKMNIAAWASKEEEENNNNNVDAEETLKIEFENRAMAWEEAEKSKHNARYKREEIRIQAWESQERAKLEAEMRRIEAKVEQMKAEAEAKMVKKIAMAKQRSEEKRASAEARKARDAEKAVAEAQYIRETGRIPTSCYKICRGWFS